jgi:hypothetical protein
MKKDQLFDLMDNNLEIVKEWIQENLFMANEAKNITGQSPYGFKQSVWTNQIKSFIHFGNERKTHLYLKKDLLEYRKNKRK